MVKISVTFVNGAQYDFLIDNKTFIDDILKDDTGIPPESITITINGESINVIYKAKL